MINIFESGANEHIERTIYVAESLHSPSTTTQLSGARSTTELIAHRAGLSNWKDLQLQYQGRKNSSISPFKKQWDKWAAIISACYDLR